MFDRGLRVHAADPAGARVVGAMAAEDGVDLFDQAFGAIDLTEREEIADGERVGPQVTLRWRVDRSRRCVARTHA